jgi:hypothetical protein
MEATREGLRGFASQAGFCCEAERVTTITVLLEVTVSKRREPSS